MYIRNPLEITAWNMTLKPKGELEFINEVQSLPQGPHHEDNDQQG